jgi:flagellar hook-basal body complex protein FliE
MKINGPAEIQFHQPANKTEVTEKSNTSGAFANLLTDTNEHLLAADNALQQLASGQSTSLHQTMLTLEEAKISFQFLEQVRNRLMSAWQDILREQI